MTPRRQLVRELHLDQLAFWRNPQSAFFTFALPLVLVLIFGLIAGDEVVPQQPDVEAVALLVPGFLSFGVILASYGNLAGSIAVLRADGVLKRIRATPLDPSIYLAGHLLSALVTSVAIAISTVIVGFVVFGVHPTSTGLVYGIPLLALGAACFASLGLALTALIHSADSAGPITNGTLVPLAIISGSFSYELELPPWLNDVVSALPVKALTDGLRAAYVPGSAVPTREFAVLAIWTVIGSVLARLFFRWQ